VTEIRNSRLFGLVCCGMINDSVLPAVKKKGESDEQLEAWSVTAEFSQLNCPFLGIQKNLAVLVRVILCW
jgi:hypothetical protein